MYKAADEGPKIRELTAFHRTSGLREWFSVTTAPRGTYRTCDIVAMLRKHLEDADERARFEIVIADDFSAHKSGPVRDLVWLMGAFLMIWGAASLVPSSRATPS